MLLLISLHRGGWTCTRVDSRKSSSSQPYDQEPKIIPCFNMVLNIKNPTSDMAA